MLLDYYTNHKWRCLLVFVWIVGSAAVCEAVPNITGAVWDGNIAYFSIPRENIADKLDSLKDQRHGCAQEKVSLPTDPILQSLLGPNEHVIGVAAGRLTATTVDQNIPQHLEGEYFTVTDTVQFFIPFLSGEDPGELPKYKLAITSFVSTPDPFISPNPTIPVENVDLVLDTSRRVYIGDGSESFSMLYPRTRRCTNISSTIIDEYEQYIEEYTISAKEGPDYTAICEEAAFKHLGLCTRRVTCESCESWIPSKDPAPKTCYASEVHLGTITAGMEEATWLAGASKTSVMSMDMKGVFDIGFHEHCF